jgi:ribosomal protein L3 glutamine methyltransferase
MSREPDARTREPVTAAEYLRWGEQRLREAGVHLGHGTDAPLDEAAALVLHAAGLPFDAAPAVLDRPLTAEQQQRARMLIERRIAERVPAPYLTGEAWFAGLRFAVDARVLVPRSPIAELIVDGYAPWVATDALERVLDLCTGSGCIGIATAVHLPWVEVDASDLSADALALAADNVAAHGVADRVRLVQSDLFDALGGRQYDLIVSNPPYVDAADMAGLPAEYRHEPALALAAGSDGLDLVLRILREAAAHLTAQGALICEVGNSWVALEQRCPGVPFTWLEFEYGASEVFVLTRDELVTHAAAFR